MGIPFGVFQTPSGGQLSLLVQECIEGMPSRACHDSKSNCSSKEKGHHIIYIGLPRSTLECILFGIVSVEIHLNYPIQVH